MPAKTTSTREDACEALVRACWRLDETCGDTPDATIDAMVARIIDAYAQHVQARAEGA